MNSRSKKNYFQEEILDPCIHLENRVRKKLIRRYEKPLSYHDVKMINDIIYNEKTHYVELFKEYLIYEDINEFLKRFYNINEISIKLPRILLFYEKYSKIYANYTVIPESKYMYKNIKRKQKMIDQMQNNNDDNDDEEEEEEGEDLPNIILNTKAMNSINSFTMSIFGNDSISKNSKTETSVNNLLNKINNYERNAQKIKVRNKNNRKSNTNNLNKNKLRSIEQQQSFCYKKIGNTFCFFGDKFGNPLLVIGPHWPMYVCFCGFMSFIFMLLFYSFWDLLNSTLKILGVLNFCLYFFSYTYIFIVNPGFPTINENSFIGMPREKYKYCNECKIWVSNDRNTEHCFDCNVCVEGYDHHCPWTSKCVGKNNLLIFNIFLKILFINICYMFFALITIVVAPLFK